MGEERQCGNPRCRASITIKHGHRYRKYCDDACKQAAHRAREVEAQRIAEEAARQARIERERLDLRKKFGNFLPETIDLLQALPGSASRIAKVVRAEIEHARKSQAQELNELIEYIMLTGEKLGFQALKNDDFALDEGIENWLILCQNASLEELYQAQDIMRIKLRAPDARRRLADLASHS